MEGFIVDWLKNTLAGYLRIALASVLTWAVSNGIITDGQTENVLIGIAGFIIIGVWSLWSRWRKSKELKVAAEAPAGIELATIKEVASKSTTTLSQ